MAATDKWAPINDYPGDQRYDHIRGTADTSYWGQIGADGDHGWHWCIVAQNADGDTWETASGTAEDEAAAARIVEHWNAFKVGSEVQIVVGGPHENYLRIATVGSVYENGDMSIYFGDQDEDEWVYSPGELRDHQA